MAGKKGPVRGPAKKTTTKPQAPAKEKLDKSEKLERPRPSREELADQQRIIDIFSHTFAEVLSSAETFTLKLQEVKQALFNRDFATAFGKEENLEVYAARWSPTRALCYASVFRDIRPYLDEITRDESSETAAGSTGLPGVRVLSVGGAAAEVVAFGGLLHESEALSGDLTLLDSGPWASVVSRLEQALTTPPPLSKYASEVVRAANVAFVPPSRLTARFVMQDVLELEKPRLAEAVGASPCLVTLFFTLNELFTSSGIGKTTAFLLNLTAISPVGSLLLVVDSPGSYSEMTLGKQEKRYPMQWLMDKVLLGTEEEPVEGRRWVKLESHDSLWFRLHEDLQYPIPLENMRYQMHLYRAEEAVV